MENNYYILNYILYQIISPQNKIYIGVTNNFERRKQEHLNNIQTGQIKLYRHLRQFKPDQIKFEIIKYNLSPKQAHALERVYIKKIGQFNSLNERIGGEGIEGIYTELEQEHRNYINNYYLREL